MKKIVYFCLLIVSLLPLAACNKPIHSTLKNQRIILKLDKQKMYDISQVGGKATKGSTVIFEPHNKNNDIEKMKSDSHDGTFAEGSLLPGTYTVYAEKNGKKSSKQQLKVMDYISTHSTPDYKEPSDDSSEVAESISNSKAADSEYTSISNSIAKSESSKSSSTKSSYSSRYKHVSIDDFIADPDSYDGKDIQISGTVSYIQRNLDDRSMDYVVLNNNDDTAATVTEIETDDIRDYHVTEGNHITVKGGGLTKTVKLNGKTLRSDIIVDSISK